MPLNTSQHGDMTVVSVGKLPDDHEVPEIVAGDLFRQSIKSDAIMDSAGVPKWYGWAILAAFRAGAKWQREQYSKITHVTITADSTLAQGALEKLRENITGIGRMGTLRPSGLCAQGEPVITASNVAVDKNYHWQPMSTCPVNSKVQLLGQGGLPSYGKWDGKDSFYVGWQLIPTRAPE